MAISENDKAMIKRLQDNLSTIRNLGGWSIREFADMCNVSPQTISNWEAKDSSNPMYMGNYWMIVAALGAEMTKRGDDDVFTKLVTYILSGEDNEKSYEENTKKIATLGQTAKGGASSEVIGALAATLGVAVPIVGSILIGKSHIPQVIGGLLVSYFANKK